MKPKFKNKNRTVIYAPPENVVQRQHSSSEGFKHTVKGQSHYFKVDGKPVAFVLDKKGFRSKDEISPSAVRLVMNFFAKLGVDYHGKVSQEEVEKFSD
jgi:hypothetical protein